jgi:uncharacterized protein (TIGR04255 family)
MVSSNMNNAESKADLMNSQRPADLPDFKSPPLTEVVLGAQFDVIPGFLTPHLGLIWQHFRGKFPHIEEQPPLLPVFETFGSNPQFAASFQLNIRPDPPRLIFINESRTELLQVQKDRFLHNWRKFGAGDDYPRFERMLQTFESGFTTYVDAIVDAGLPRPVPNQCEVTYINQIPVPEGQSLSELSADLFGQHTGNLILADLGEAEDLRFMIRYVIRDEAGEPYGRMIASAEPARRLDGQLIVQLTMTARGRPLSPTMGGVVDFFMKGRAGVVRGFAHLTGPKMHKIWERTQ